MALNAFEDDAWVMLTKAGVEFYTAYLHSTSLSAARVKEILEKRQAGEGWWRFRLHELMYIFGRRLFSKSQDTMFENDLVLFSDPTKRPRPAGE